MRRRKVARKQLSTKNKIKLIIINTCCIYMYTLFRSVKQKEKKKGHKNNKNNKNKTKGNVCRTSHKQFGENLSSFLILHFPSSTSFLLLLLLL